MSTAKTPTDAPTELDWDDPVIDLEDQDGQVIQFEMLAILEIDEDAYAVLTPRGVEQAEGEPTEIQILRYVEAADESFTLEPIHDEALEAELFEVVSQTLSQAAEE